MMDSIGYQFDPTQQKALAGAFNETTAQFGPLAQRALQVLSMRIPSIGGGQPLSGADPMQRPMMPAPVQQGNSGLHGLVNGALNPTGGQQKPADGGSILFKFPGQQQQSPQMPQQGPQQGTGQQGMSGMASSPWGQRSSY